MKRALVIAAAAAALLGGARVEAGPSEVIFPPQRLPLTFSHKRHLDKKIDCDFCHEKAPTSTKSSDNLIPSEDVCSTCHPIDRDHPELNDKKHATGCATCHTGWKLGGEVQRVVMPAPFIKFDHQAHVSRGVACTRCHTGLDRLELATRAQIPTMSLCLDCHDSSRGSTSAPPATKPETAPNKLHAPSRCSTCHLMQPDSTLQTAFPTGALMPSGVLRGDAHTLAFRTNHKAAAQNDDKYCANCHRRDFCLGCHNGVVKPMDFHGNDYVSRHPIDARRNTPDCSACHRAQSFCLGCHERMGVVDARTGVDGAFVPRGSQRFHPAGWADPTAIGNKSHHAWQAQRNIKQCAACHRQETCLQCHASNDSDAGKSGKMWVNPHPPDWRSSSRCSALADRNVRVCLRCHRAGAPELSCKPPSSM